MPPRASCQPLSTAHHLHVSHLHNKVDLPTVMFEDEGSDNFHPSFSRSTVVPHLLPEGI